MRYLRPPSSGAVGERDGLGGHMLSYYLHDGSSAFRFKLSGALVGRDVDEVEQCRRTAWSTIGERNFLVDVSDLTNVDDRGRALLGAWHRNGAQFIAKSAHSRSLVASIMGHDFTVASIEDKTAGGRMPWRIAALALAAAASLLVPATVSADDTDVNSPSAVLSRYTASVERANIRVEGEAVVIDIDASLPKLAKTGRLQAIRRHVPLGKPQYEVLESEGDRTVRQQVIARYLSADAQALSLPASSMAMSPANYKFRFLAAIGNDSTLTYVYRITPKKKRVGLIQGELWIDAASGVAVHQHGRLVKSPSMFLRRVDVVQDTDIREGSPYLRITRLGIETRLVGRAELTIKEHPGQSAEIPVTAVMSAAPRGQ
jgi:hypothetical protein